MARSYDVPSPCVKVCQIDAAGGLCRGCLRTLDEIARWSSMTPADKLATLHAVGERRRALPVAAGPLCSGGRG
jgi:predicted Fe-S protein YdhL (DUF1289 family)